MKPNHTRDDFNQFNTPISKALAIGLNAASPHNTQAWKFKIINNTEAELYVDETRLLPQTDPPARQIHIGCGCFLETLSIGASIIKHEAKISLFPSGQYDIKDLGLKPVALIKLQTSDKISNHPLADYIFKRQTSRLNYDGELITNEQKEILIKDANSEFSKLVIQNQAEEIKPFLDIFKEAMNIESYNLATYEETRRMFRFSKDEIESKRDGLTLEGQGTKGIAKLFAKMLMKNTSESWNKKSNINAGLRSFNKGVDSSKGIVYWVTDTNRVTDWINVGRDITRFLLMLTKNNLYAHPLNQAIQEYKEMDGLRTKLDALMKITQGQKIQMIVRIGKSDKPFVSYRRHFSDIKNIG